MRAGPPPVEIDELLALIISENGNISRPGQATIQTWREFGTRLTLRELLTINYHRGPYSDGYIAPEIQDVLLLVFGSLRVRAEVDSGAAAFRSPLQRRRGTSRPNEGSDRLNRRRRTELEENGVVRERRRLVAPRVPSAPPLQSEFSATDSEAHTAQPPVQLAGQATRSANPHRDRTPAEEQAANAQIAAEFAADPSTSMHDASFWQAVIEDFRSALRSRDSRSE